MAVRFKKQPSCLGHFSIGTLGQFPVGANSLPPGTALKLVATAEPGYLFKRWNGCPNAIGPECEMALNRSATVKAIFAPLL